MDNASGFTGIMYRVTDWIMKFVVINIMWLIFNLPIVYVIFVVLSYGEISKLGLLVLPLALFTPFLFFPATMAMFGTVREWIIIEKNSGLLVKAFWRNYKANYKKSMLAGLIFTFVWLVWLVDLYFLSSVHILFVYLFIMIGAILFVVTINFFSINAHYVANLRTIFKNALIITFTGPGLFITILLINLFTIYTSLYAFRFLLVFFTFSGTAFLSFGAFNQLYIKPALYREEKSK